MRIKTMFESYHFTYSMLILTSPVPEGCNGNQPWKDLFG